MASYTALIYLILIIFSIGFFVPLIVTSFIDTSEKRELSSFYKSVDDVLENGITFDVPILKDLPSIPIPWVNTTWVELFGFPFPKFDLGWIQLNKIFRGIHIPTTDWLLPGDKLRLINYVNSFSYLPTELSFFLGLIMLVLFIYIIRGFIPFLNSG